MLVKSTYECITPVVVLLTFQKASHINGQTIVVDGGTNIDLKE
jgi:hypothetical protein